MSSDDEDEKKSDKPPEKISSDESCSARTDGSSNEGKVTAKESSPIKSGVDSSSATSSNISSNCTLSTGVMSPPKFVPLGTPSKNTEER